MKTWCGHGYCRETKTAPYTDQIGFMKILHNAMVYRLLHKKQDQYTLSFVPLLSYNIWGSLKKIFENCFLTCKQYYLTYKRDLRLETKFAIDVRLLL